MAIKNYTTSINTTNTVGEIQQILVKAGAKTFNIEYFQGEVEAVCFSIIIKTHYLSFRLPSNPHGVLDSMKRDNVQKSLCSLEHARKVSWRIIKDWIHAQIALIDANQAEFAEVFFPYMLSPSGETAYEAFMFSQMQIGE